MDSWLDHMYRSMILENTRLLVKGVERLHKVYSLEHTRSSQFENPWQLDKLRQFIETAYQNSRDGKDFLYQNPNTELFRFRNFSSLQDDGATRLSGMLLLYHQLQILEGISVDQLSDVYETLCNSIRIIQGADMCYLVFRRQTDTRILCSSSVNRRCLDSQLSSREAEKLLDRLMERKQIQEITKGIYLANGVEWAENTKATDSWQKIQFLLLPILLYDAQGANREEQAYLICQQEKEAGWSSNISDTLLRVRDTLFLRGQLAQALMRDLYSLLAALREYRDISRRSKDGCPLQILHVSDLHVTEQNCQVIKGAISQLKLDAGSFDFLVITGDVAQGRSSAGDLERHYDCAAEVIRALAFHMWSDTDGGEQVLHQDWKRRTIIIPGNHDYASMNELETQHGENHRASEGGRPAAKEGSAMAKFTYYINFVRKLLDEDIGELIDNNLNVVRRYDKMGVDFLCFNTSIMANPARNNKVHLDKDFAQQVIHRLTSRSRERFLIFLGHHGPDYQVDYVSDEYLERYICRTITEQYAAAIQKENDSSRQDALKQLKISLENLEHADENSIIDNAFIQAWLLENAEQYLPANIEEKVIRRRKKTRLYHELIFLLEQLDLDMSERSINERYQKIIAEVNRTRLLSQNDQQAYKTVFDQLDKALHLTASLSGHTHEWEINSDINHYVAKRFQWERIIQKPGSNELERKISLHYGVCTLSWAEGKPNINYQQCDEDVGIT